jgi:hypothetical protein
MPFTRARSFKNAVLAIGLGGVVAATGAFAQAKADEASQPAKKKRVIRLDTITVEGRIQKPQAFYILQRSTLNFDELNRAETFIPKVEKSVEKELF